MLLEKITQDIKEAMKAKEAETLSTLRMLSSSLKNKKIELGKELEEEDVLSVVKKEMKSLQDSLESFVEGAREDLAEKAKKEMEIIKKYLPEEMDDASLEEVVKAVVAEVGATTKAEMGKVMGATVKKVAGAADGKRIKEMVERLLS